MYNVYIVQNINNTRFPWWDIIYEKRKYIEIYERIFTENVSVTSFLLYSQYL